MAPDTPLDSPNVSARVPPSNRQHDAWVRLLSASSMSLTRARDLVNVHGSPQDLIEAANSGALDDADCRAILAARPEAEAVRLASMGGTFIAPWDRAMPPSLVNLPDPPGLLRVKGTIETATAVAIVGTRRCSEAGRRAAHFFGRELARCGVTVVSGGARGIDAAAHRGALEAGGRTVAVLGSGLGRLYPPEHAGLFREIVDAGGGLLSEHHVDQHPRPGFFPRRNRLISGLSLGVLVIEAPVRSGAMGTARIAVESHGRDCWALLADAHRTCARGGLEAIRDGWARPVIEPIDVLGDLPGIDGASAEARVADEAARQPIPDARCDLKLLAALVHAGRTLDAASLAQQARVDLDRAMVELTRLHLLGAVRPDHGRWGTTPAGVAWLGEARRSQS